MLTKEQLVEKLKTEITDTHFNTPIDDRDDYYIRVGVVFLHGENQIKHGVKHYIYSFDYDGYKWPLSPESESKLLDEALTGYAERIISDYHLAVGLLEIES